MAQQNKEQKKYITQIQEQRKRIEQLELYAESKFNEVEKLEQENENLKEEKKTLISAMRKTIETLSKIQ